MGRPLELVHAPPAMAHHLRARGHRRQGRGCKGKPATRRGIDLKVIRHVLGGGGGIGVRTVDSEALGAAVAALLYNLVIDTDQWAR